MTAPPTKHPVSVIILTKNEEVNIRACLDCLTFSDDVIVYDSFSTDSTVEIARTYPNVTVVQRAFDNWSAHQNWGVQNIRFKHPWVLYVDADERVNDDLRDELQRRADPACPLAAFRMRRKDMFMGTWLKRSQLYPTWIVRLFRPDKIRYERLVNPVAVIDGDTGNIDSHLIHYPFSKGLLAWFVRHNSYSTFEAKELRKIQRPPLALSELFSSDPNTRRNALKTIFYAIPARPLVRFIYLVAVRGGFLEGRAGVRYAGMISMYEYWISLKMLEANQEWPDRTNDLASRMLGTTHQRAPVGPDGVPLVEVMIPTFNEAAHIAETVANARSLGPVHVLDSISTDGTQALAREAGAQVYEHKFESYSRQKNWGLDNIQFRAPWIYILDADERVTPDLRAQIIAAVTAADGCTGYYINRMVIFMGSPIRHGGLYPSWNLRLFQCGKCRYEDRVVHEHMLCDGPTDNLSSPMLHLRRESMTEYLSKHIKYADMESSESLRSLTTTFKRPQNEPGFTGFMRYRQYLRREVWPRVPFKPLARFVYMYFIRLGFLDGKAGWHLALLMASYEYMIHLLTIEKLHAAREKAAQHAH